MAAVTLVRGCGPPVVQTAASHDCGCMVPEATGAVPAPADPHLALGARTVRRADIGLVGDPVMLGQQPNN
jgi:hypothetical protein